VLAAKLVSGKVTFVHRRLWHALVAVGQARQGWQVDDLSPDAADLLAEVDEHARVQASGKPAKALEKRLLVASQQVHTDSGAHALGLMTWARFADHHEVALGSQSPAAAQAELARAVAAMTSEFGGRARLPWPRLP